MDGELTSLPKIRTDAVAPAVPKKEGGHGQRRQFERHLHGASDTLDEHEHPPPGDVRRDEEEAPLPDTKKGTILNFEA